MKKRFLSIILVCILVSQVSVFARPEPSRIEKPGQWTLQVRYEHPRQIQVQLPGWEKPRRFWYLILSVTNESFQQEIPFFPKCELVTNTFKVYPAGQGSQEQIYDLIRQRHVGQYPFLESLNYTDTRIRKGADNTRDFVIILSDFDPQADHINIFIGGLSNETAVVMHPIRRNEMGQPEKIYLQKTLQLTYSLGADPKLRQQANLQFVEQNWIMR